MRCVLGRSFAQATTVGYGDKTAKTLEARLFAVMWIVAGVVLVAMLTGTFTNTLTSYGLMEPWDWIQDTNGTIGVLQYTTAELVAERGAVSVAVDFHTRAFQTTDHRVPSLPSLLRPSAVFTESRTRVSEPHGIV